MAEKLLLMGEPKKSSLRWNLLVKMLSRSLKWHLKDLEYDVNLADKTVAGCERTGSTFESSFPVDQMLSNSTAYPREKTCLKVLSHLEKLPQPSTTMIYHQASTMRAKCSTNKKITTC